MDVKNKKGNSSTWLAARGGHLEVIKILHEHGANLDSQNNMNVSCLMVAFRKGHLNVVSWLINRTFEFPNDQEMIEFTNTLRNSLGKLQFINSKTSLYNLNFIIPYFLFYRI